MPSRDLFTVWCSAFDDMDNKAIVWLSDFGANASVRQILGWPGEVWLPESGVDKLVVIRE